MVDQSITKLNNNLLNKHEGKIGFVIGSGCSLRKVDANLLKEQIIIAINGAILKFPFASYFLSCDARTTLNKCWSSLKYNNCDIFLDVSCSGFDVFDNLTGINTFEGLKEDRLHFFKRENTNKMRKPTDKFIWGSSSAHVGVHLAHILGCSPIVLLGCDCCWEEGKQRYNEFANQPDNGLIKKEYANYIKNTDVICGSFKTTWEKIYLENKGINIINASGGVLNCFPRMNLMEILQQYV